MLAETTGHARIELTKVSKFTEEYKLAQKDRHHHDDTSQDVGESEGASKKTCSKDDLEKNVNHCPINHEGPSKVHLFQENLEDNAYISEIFVGNPPQKIRALFDTGSTNTWILNSKV